VTALLWAVAVTMFRGPVLEHGARTVSLVKCALGATLQGLTVLVLGQAGVLFNAPGRALLLLTASGVIGLAIGDTALFATVARLGVHRTLLLQTLAPVFTALIAWLWRHELPTPTAMLGAAVILGGVALVVAPVRSGPTENSAAGPSAWPLVVGLSLGVLAALGQGAGLVLAKVGMEQVAVIPASFLRLAAATLGLMLILTTRGRVAGVRRLIESPIMLSRVVPATFLGAYLALFLMMLGVALAPAAIAATLLSVSPVYGLFIDTIVHRRPLSARGLIGTLIAVAGVAILTHG